MEDKEMSPRQQMLHRVEGLAKAANNKTKNHRIRFSVPESIAKAFGERSRLVIAKKKNDQQITTTYKDAEKQGYFIIKFADKEEISVIRTTNNGKPIKNAK